MPSIMRMPEVAANATDAVLAAWTVPVGATFGAGETIVTVETEKAVVDIEAEDAGVMLRHLVSEGTQVHVGSPIALLGAVGEVVDDVDAALAGLGLPGPSGSSARGTTPSDGQADGSVPADAAHPGARQFASPLARRLAREAHVDLGDLVGTGPGGRLRRRDVESFLSSRRAPAAPEVEAPAAPAMAPAAGGHRALPPGAVARPGPATYVDEPVSRLRRAIAVRLTESMQKAPHFYLHGSARVDRLLALRQEINSAATVDASVNDLVVKAVARAHVLVPDMNVIWNGDSIRRFTGVDVGVAIATDAGLVTPIVRGVERLSLRELVATSQDLIARAKTRQLRQDELEGGSITVTNLGMYGTEEFAAIINPPQAAILAVGAARPEPIVVDGRVEAATMMRVILSVDHRPVDGATAAVWMKVFLGLLESPTEILI